MLQVDTINARTFTKAAQAVAVLIEIPCHLALLHYRELAENPLVHILQVLRLLYALLFAPFDSDVTYLSQEVCNWETHP
eukprot:6465375-Amphidinium_carterae.1